MWARQARRIYAEENGKVVRRYDPALMKTLSAIDLDHPLPSMWPQFEGLADVPCWVVRGANSDLLTQETVGEDACDASLDGKRHRSPTRARPGPGHPKDCPSASRPL